MKVYIVCAVWGNTKNNHAGMYYLAKQLKQRAEYEVKLIPIPVRGSWYLTPFYRLLNVFIGCYLYCVVKPGDVVFLMEYLLPVCEQADIARIVRKKAKVLALAHLIPARIEKEYATESLLRKVSYVDKLFVLGSSLRDYFLGKGIDGDKVVATFHYVDNEYYVPKAHDDKMLNVVCMGNMERNYTDLQALVSRLPKLHFHVCMGVRDLSQYFADLPNVTLHGFMPESELKALMQSSDVSLNMMNDTVGSNVITTSLASGLVVLACDVGSIADYVTDGEDGFLCDNGDEACRRLEILSKDKGLLRDMQRCAVAKAATFSIDNFLKWFNLWTR